MQMIQLTTAENTITYHNALCLSPQNLHKHCLQFLLGVKMAPRETENNAYARFWGDKQRALWYVMVFSVVVNSGRLGPERKPACCRHIVCTYTVAESGPKRRRERKKAKEGKKKAC